MNNRFYKNLCVKPLPASLLHLPESELVAGLRSDLPLGFQTSQPALHWLGLWRAQGEREEMKQRGRMSFAS